MDNPVLKWVTSSHSGNGSCVEVAVRDGVLVRDTKDRHGAVLRFTPQTWRKFAAQVKGQRT